MTNTQSIQKKDSNKLKSAALLSGLSLLLMTLAAFFAFGYAHSSLVDTGNASATLNNIIQSRGLFQAEIAAWVLIVILDVLVSYGFYTYLKPAHAYLAKQSGILRLIYSAVLGYAVLQLQFASVLAFGAEPNAVEVLSKIETFESVWSLGLIIFGIHLLFAGRAALKTKNIPKMLSILLVIAGCSYILLHSLDTFAPQLTQITSLLEIVLVLPMIVGELGFGIWLLVKGRKLTSL